MIISAVDPGKTGAMVTTFEDGSTVVDRVPLITAKGKKSRPDFERWHREWLGSICFNMPDVFVFEVVGARPGQGSVSMFNFGYSAGFARALVYGAGVPIHPAYPAVWKEKLGLIGLDKSFSIRKALQLVPSIRVEIERKILGNTADVRHGIAEAALLTYYGRMTIAG